MTNDRPQSPRVSIGLPVRNGANYIAEALDSLLGQTFTDFEIIVSDNASTDATAEIVESYAGRDSRIRYVRQPENLGAARNYNCTVELARGEYFKWAAHDDLCAPTFLERCVEVLDQHPEVATCYARTRYIDADGNPLHTSNGGSFPAGSDPAERIRNLVAKEIESDDVFMSVFGLFRITALRNTGLIASFVASDQVFLLEMALEGEFFEIEEPLFVRRLHPLTSMRKNRRPHEQAEWFDPAVRQRIVLPMWGLWRQHNAVIARSNLDLRSRVGCYYRVMHRFIRKWDALAGEVKKGVCQVLGFK